MNARMSIREHVFFSSDGRLASGDAVFYALRHTRDGTMLDKPDVLLSNRGARTFAGTKI
jgi:hypothetical protein